jgi:hypothetical protein
MAKLFFQNASDAFKLANPHLCKISDPEPQPDKASALVRANAGKAQSLLDTAYARSILTISPEVARIYSTAADTLASYLVMNRGAPSRKPRRNKSKTTRKSGH